jgi:putative membrane protein
MSKENVELAEQRTQWAEDRTLMANERSFSSWSGTGLGSLGMGIAVQAIFKATDPTWLAKLAASLFVLIAIAFFYFAWRNASQTLKKLKDHESAPASSRQLGLISAAFSFSSLFVLFLLWTL